MKFKKTDLFLFTSNRYKLNEFKKIIPKNKFRLFYLNNFKKIKSPPETGKTFKKNAKIKSIYGYKISKMPSIGEDSGICIDALNGRPGTKSKRFLQLNGGHEKTNKKIIKMIEKRKKTGATFHTVIALSFKNKTLYFCGKKRGKIVNKPLGNNGFHYDPIFKPIKSKKTYCQMKKSEKNRISHRYLALKKLIGFLNKTNQFL